MLCCFIKLPSAVLGVAKAACAFHAEPVFKHRSVLQHGLYKQRRYSHTLFVLISQWPPEFRELKWPPFRGADEALLLALMKDMKLNLSMSS